VNKSGQYKRANLNSVQRSNPGDHPFGIALTLSTTSFRAACFIRKHPDLIPQYEKTLNLLEIDPFHTSLRLHRLKGSLCDLHPVSINISYSQTIPMADSIILATTRLHEANL